MAYFVKVETLRMQERTGFRNQVEYTKSLLLQCPVGDRVDRSNTSEHKIWQSWEERTSIVSQRRVESGGCALPSVAPDNNSARRFRTSRDFGYGTSCRGASCHGYLCS
jgi:hypothetical protein